LTFRPHEDALEYLLEHSKTAKKWLQVYLSVGNKLYLQEMFSAKVPKYISSPVSSTLPIALSRASSRATRNSNLAEEFLTLLA